MQRENKHVKKMLCGIRDSDGQIQILREAGRDKIVPFDLDTMVLKTSPESLFITAPSFSSEE
jgi:hypothetical protein